VVKTDLSFFELSWIKPRRCKCHARRAAARRRRNDLRIVGDAVALNSEDHKDKGKEVAQKGHAPQSHEEQPAQKPKSTQP